MKEKRNIVIPKNPAKKTIYKDLFVKKFTSNRCITKSVKSNAALVKPKGKETNNSNKKANGNISHNIRSLPLYMINHKKRIKIILMWLNGKGKIVNIKT